MAGGWGCPHEFNDQCQHVKDRPCDPGMKGCVLAGRFRFSNEAKNRPPRPASSRAQQPKASSPKKK